MYVNMHVHIITYLSYCILRIKDSNIKTNLQQKHIT